MSRQQLICGRHKSGKAAGYLLLDALLAVLAAAALLGFAVKATSDLGISLKTIQEQIRLQEARRHILAQLEKTLAYDATKIVLENNKINCVSLTGNKKLVIYNDKKALYQRTTTGEGTGVNPLSLEDVGVNNLQAAALDAHRLCLSFTLQVNERRRNVVQVIYCYNARINDG